MADYDQLADVLRSVQDRFEYRPDLEVWGRLEHWPTEAQIPDEGPIVGDCDDHAIAVRKALRRLGIPSRLVYCRTETGGGHLVTEVEGWILDNRQPWPTPRDDLPYEWVRISGYEPGDPWHKITG